MSRLLLLSLLVALSGTAQAATFKLKVNAADAHGHVRRHFVYKASGCHGGNVSPSLAWHGAPKGTRGFAVTVYDPDAKGGWWHWIVLDIPRITQHIKQGGPLPPGAFALENSFGHARWDGPCPPADNPPHHYVFTVYALDTAALGLSADTTPAEAKIAMAKHILGKVSVTYTFGR